MGPWRGPEIIKINKKIGAVGPWRGPELIKKQLKTTYDAVGPWGGFGSVLVGFLALSGSQEAARCAQDARKEAAKSPAGGAPKEFKTIPREPKKPPREAEDGIPTQNLETIKD